MLICVGMSPLLYVCTYVLSGGLASVGDVSDPMAGCASPQGVRLSRALPLWRLSVVLFLVV